MTNREDLEKLFEAALHEKAAPSRFGTPEEQKKATPKAFQNPVERPSPTPAPSSQEAPALAFQPAPEAPSSENAFQAAPQPSKASDLIDIAETGDPFAEQAIKSKDTALSAELGAILDEKVAREKKKKTRGKLVLVGLLLATTGGASAWVVMNPERFEAMKQVVAEIKSAGDIKGMVAKYQAALDKVAVRGEQINAATESMGVDPASMADAEDQGFDKEMREMMGEEGGPTTAARDKILREKFKSVEETGSLIKKTDE